MVHAHELHQNVFLRFEEGRERVYCKHLCYVSKLLYKVDYNNNNLIYAPTYAYVMPITRSRDFLSWQVLLSMCSDASAMFTNICKLPIYGIICT